MNMYDHDIVGAYERYCDEPSYQPRGRTLTAADIAKRMGLEVAGPKPVATSIPTSRTATLTTHTMANLRALFRTYKNHQPSEQQFEALEQVARHLSAQATGEPFAHCLALAPIPCGVGKTSVLTTFIRTILADPAYNHVGIIVFANQLEQLRKLVEACFGTRQEDIEAARRSFKFALRTSDPDLDALGVDHEHIPLARVLFTTQARLIQEVRVNGRSFNAITEFHYLRPGERTPQSRLVKAWDETILPGLPLVIKANDPLDLRRIADKRLRNDRLAVALKTFSRDIEDASPDTLLLTPHWEQDFGVSMSDIMRFARHDQDLQETILALWLMQGLPGVVRHELGNGSNPAVLTYEDNLPADIGAMTVLDASGTVRKTYEVWAKERDDLVILSEARKAYRNLKIHLWNVRGGKGAFRENPDDLIAGMVEAIESKPATEEWLIVHHKAGRGVVDVKAILQERVENPSRLSFVSYGRHSAINDFAHIPNVILAGIMYLPDNVIEAITRIVERRRPEEDLDHGGKVLTRKDRIDEVRLGEVCHVVLQAANRGSVRGSLGDDCQPCDLYIMASAKSGVTYDLLHRIVFPESLVLHWRPKCDRQPLHAWDRLIAWAAPRLQNVGDRALFKDAYNDLGVSGRGNFQTKYRQSWQFQTWCQLMGIEEFAGGDSPANVWKRKKAQENGRELKVRMQGWHRVCP